MQKPGLTELKLDSDGRMRKAWMVHAKSTLSNFESKYRRFMISGVKHTLLDNFARMLGDSTFLFECCPIVYIAGNNDNPRIDPEPPSNVKHLWDLANGQ